MDWDVWGFAIGCFGDVTVVIGIFIAFRDEDKSVRKDRNSELDARKDQIMEQITRIRCRQRQDGLRRVSKTS